MKHWLRLSCPQALALLRPCKWNLKPEFEDKQEEHCRNWRGRPQCLRHYYLLWQCLWFPFIPVVLVNSPTLFSECYYPLLHPDFYFFFSCSFDLKVGLIGIVHPGKRQTLKSTESSKHLSLPVEVQIHCISMLCGSEISKTMFPFFTAPLFAMPFSCPSLSPGASCLLLGAHREMLWAQSGRWLLPGSWVGSVGW